MWTRSLPLALSLLAVATSAAKVSFKQIKHRPTLERRGYNGPQGYQLAVNAEEPDNGLDLSTVQDLIYLANITVGGNDYVVQLDTGSSDLWLKGPVTPLPNSSPTTIPYNLSYAIGWAAGNLSYAPVKFANLSVPSQVFLDVSSAVNPALGYGANGIAGLGFTSLSSLDHAVNKTGQSSGRSLLYNLFSVNPKEPNFLAFLLQRSTDAVAEDDVEGSFSIGEYEPEFEEVSNSTKISTWPPHSPSRWNVLLDAVILGTDSQIIMPTTDVVGAPGNKAVVLMDSGSSYTYAPKDIVDKIYGNITGARYDATLGQWVVPCDYEVDMALQIGGQVFPLHPLDVTPKGLSDTTICVGSFVGQSVSVGAGEFDWLIGDNFLRSVYSIYDFGDYDSNGVAGDPYMRMLPIIDPVQGSKDFHKLRGGTPKTNITYQGLEGVTALPSFNISQDISDSLERIGKFIPAVLGIVALNALVLLVLAVAGAVMWCRRRNANRTPARTPRGRLSPMPFNPNARNSYAPGHYTMASQSTAHHTYEPVSMAMTEDTFVPPSPAFRNSQAADRPKSVA
jgi:saccharopepsin